MSESKIKLLEQGGQACALEECAEAVWTLRDEDPLRAQVLLEPLLERAADDPLGRAVGLIVQGFLHFRNSRYDLALEALFESQTLIGEGIPVWNARLFNTLGGCYILLGEREPALKAYQEQLAWAKESGIAYEIFSAYHDLGVYFSIAGDNLHAWEFYKKAEQLCPPDARSRAFLERNLADYYADQGAFAEAKVHAQRALDLGAGMLRVVETALQGLALIATRQHDYSEALRIYSDLQTLHVEAGHASGDTSLSMARCLLALGDSRSALTYLYQALRDLELGGSNYLLADCHNLLSEAHKHLGAFEKALEHHERFHLHHVKMFRESSEVKVRGLEVIHRMNSLKEESERLQQENENLERHNEALQDLHDRVRELSIRDALTGLYNRRYLLEQLAQIVKLARRYGHSLSVVMLDIDHFKQVNDTYGHKTGDAVLTRVGELLLTTLRETDLSARYGGEEFAVVMPNTTLTTAVTTCERLRQHLCAYDWQVLCPGLQVTVSIGVAASSAVGPEDEEALFAQADAQLYLAKRSGRNRVSFDTLLGACAQAVYGQVPTEPGTQVEQGQA